MGPIFAEIYDKNIVSVRLAEKEKPKKERDMVIMEGYKLAANGSYGKDIIFFPYLPCKFIYFYYLCKKY